MTARHVLFALMSLCTTACGFDRGRIEGQIQYVDSRWDPAGAPLPVPPLLVHVMPGTEVMRRDILSAYAAVVARGIPGKDVAGIVEYVEDVHAGPDALTAVAARCDGSFELDKLRKGSYLVFADYSTDLGYVGWLEVVDVEGTRTTTIDLTFDNRLPIVIPLEAASRTGPEMPPLDQMQAETPPAPLQIEVPIDQVPSVLEKLGMDASP